MNDEGASTLRELTDKQAITEILYTYCRAMDRMDRAAADAIWAESAEVDYGAFYKGAAAGLLDAAWAFHATMSGHSHQVTNILIRLSGDTAASETYFIAALRRSEADGATTQLNSRGRYLDRWTRTRRGWAIAHRTVVADMTDVVDIAASGFADRGRRDRSDPSYDYLP